MLEGTSKLYKHPKARTLYLTIPATIAGDSQFPFKPGDKMKVVYEIAKHRIIISKYECAF